MSGARLLSLRLHGFKSFAEKTLVEFGPGISAVVGPNGSGKSNLADGLRWALGEQGRSLRVRKSEDVVWAGSEKRAAVGMADVSLLLDNSDALLPLEYSVIELGRRLYRSGENDYLLNRQRVRLRDLVDLLDAANLADNAFLFIGQGMVDQALALRPEERRPLFEEVAGVRRHERRRRKAEEQLAESETNLARVEDILAELRPQARRLAIQAEQHASRLTAGDELGAALLASAHARWHAAAADAERAAVARARSRAEAERLLAELSAAEADVAAIGRELDDRAAQQAERRARHEAARAALMGLRLRRERLASEHAALLRDRERLIRERDAAGADLAAQRRRLALPVPERNHELEASLADAERTLTDALAELAGLRAARQAEGEQIAALRRVAAARASEREAARRRAADAERRLAEERARADTAAAQRAGLEAELGDARSALAAILETLEAALAEREVARSALEAAEADHAAANVEARTAAETLAAARARRDAARARLDEEESRGIARAARRRGGRRVDEELAVEPELRSAVEAALGEGARAYVLARDQIGELGSERGVLVAAEALETGPVGRRRGDSSDRAEPAVRILLDAVLQAGGGRLSSAVRRDPGGAATRLLERVVWLPDLPAALGVQAILPEGWLAATRDGSAVVGTTLTTLGHGDPLLERRAQLVHLESELEQLGASTRALEARAAAAGAAADDARARLDAASRAEASGTSERRRLEEVERRVARALEAVAREAGWHAAQVERLTAELDRERDAERAASAGAGPHTSPGSDAATAPDGAGGSGGATGTADASPTGAADPIPSAAVTTWQRRVDELRARRERLADAAAQDQTVRRAAEHERAQAEAAAGLDEQRIARAEADEIELAGREAALRTERESLGRDLAVADGHEQRARVALEELIASDAADRIRLAEAERTEASARDRLRTADERVRAADVADLEARLGLDAIREGILVELAGLGDLGLRILRDRAVDLLGPEEPATSGWRDDGESRNAGPSRIAGADARAPTDLLPPDEADPSPLLEQVIARLAPAWAATPPQAEPPSPSRLAQLRRRYHELGAANPFAVEEYREARERLETLEAQQADLRSAIARTRSLIDELNDMIADQFRSTFRALEAAFDQRFQQLFGGGFARLALTDPNDLPATGVEIVARPPGKKAQALAMLSGGERALTAVALLFAMLEVRPVPFCVLDEVDAALDEANVGRFADALESLADRTQFIVITHNRGTIERADALYGVTVGQDSVSRVISLRLDEATALAQRGRAGQHGLDNARHAAAQRPSAVG